ncbi:MAG: accessory gene regulator B family protein [Oscillospiraceae bacterium]|nr:accessory gene regulator B family protein [Oscillospiraceae bacterium]
MLSSSIIAEKLVFQATSIGAIKYKDHDLYLYAFHALISYTCSFATMFVIAFLMNRLIESVIFIFFFYPLRIYAGGFHEKSELRCYITSTIMFISMILIDIVGVPGIPVWTSCVLLALSVTVVFMKAPVESEKKPLSQGELRKYKMVARLICVIETCIIITGVAFGVQQIYLYYAVSGVATTATLLVYHIYETSKYSNKSKNYF